MIHTDSMFSVLLTLLALVLDASAIDWGYEGPRGPANWEGYCRDKSQSPIDLTHRVAKPKTEEAFHFVDYDTLPKEGTLKNMGSTIKYYAHTKDHDKMPQVNGGGLPGTYAFAQFHFHWGQTNNTGSEHTVNGKSYVSELHLVHFNTKYGHEIAEAIAAGRGAQDTLAVLGIMLELRDKPNEKLDPIIRATEEIPIPTQSTYTKLFPLYDLLPEDRNQFFRYNGSLTTPGCNEIVVWTVFKEPIGISIDQLSRMRRLGDNANSPNMRFNFRPVQPLNGRQVFDVHASASERTFSTLSAVSLVVAAAVVAKMVH